MGQEHRYAIETKWTGNLGSGTSAYRAYSRNHEISAAGKAVAIQGSSDAAFRGDASRYNPEEMLVASLSTCHMLWALHLCADQGIAVVEYTDSAEGTMAVHEDGGGEFVEVILRPRMVINDEVRLADAMLLHQKAHELCFIARSVKFPVRHEPVIEVRG